MNMPHLRYVTFSYSSSLTERDNGKFKDLITSVEYQTMYGDHVQPRKTGETKVSNWEHGWKLASSVGGVGTGERGDRAIIDDPHNVKESESKLVRQETIRWFRESLSSRLNDMENGAKVVIMQRVNEEDVSGTIIGEMDGWCHLLIPMEYVWSADEDGEPFTTDIGWSDPRWKPDMSDCEGDLAWPERFPERIIPTMKSDASKFAWSSQYQQTPETRGGAIFEREWWQPWEPTDGKFPPFTYIVASCDSAFGNKENSDPSACVVLGIFENDLGFNRVMVIEAWRRNLKFSGPRITMEPGERGMAFLERQRKNWGLVEWLADTCARRKADRLLIENKASGISAAQSLANSHPYAGWAVQLIEPKGDKWTRAQAVQPTFSQELVYIPWPLRQWGADLVDEMAIFPKGKHDDLTDAMTQGIKHLRDSGLLRNDDEIRHEEREAMKPKKKQKALYPGMRG
jgi:predicted phage terminase large subunit-like protein